MSKRRRETFPCPHCGEDVPAGAKACPHCGADDDTGWAEDADYAGLDLPNTSADDDEDSEWAEQTTGRRRTYLLIGLVVVFIILTLLARS